MHEFMPAPYAYVMPSPSACARPIGLYSETSVILQRAQSMKVAVAEILSECSKANWDGEGAQPVQPITAATAEKVISTLPLVIEPPSLYPMANGKIAFQWVGRNRSGFLISVDDRGWITYSAVMKNGEKKSGSKAFLGTLPSDVSEPLLQAAV